MQHRFFLFIFTAASSAWVPKQHRWYIHQVQVHNLSYMNHWMSPQYWRYFRSGSSKANRMTWWGTYKGIPVPQPLSTPPPDKPGCLTILHDCPFAERDMSKINSKTVYNLPLLHFWELTLSHVQVPPHRFESPRLQAIQAETLGLQRPRPSSCFESMTSCYIFWPYRSYPSLAGGAQLSCSNAKLKAWPQQNSCWRAARTTMAWEDLPPKVRVK